MYCPRKRVQVLQETGYRIVKSSADLAIIADAVLAHHENWDGSGYPRGLKGHRIPLLSRIISIVDSYDVMRSKKPYKDAINKEEAITQMVENSGTRYDPDLVKIFISIIKGKNNDTR
ncbi:MAG: HD domain-containing protein [Actinobacteria bacterium]|nr:HD domain-containing protein [Actinomycetota bacterium]